jgi:hypothetical protein
LYHRFDLVVLYFEEYDLVDPLALTNEVRFH